MIIFIFHDLILHDYFHAVKCKDDYFHVIFEVIMNIKEKIHALAGEKGISIPKLEDELGLGNGTISRWSKSSPSVSKLLPIAKYFNVTLDYLIGESKFRNEQEARHLKQANTKLDNINFIEPNNTRSINVYGSIPAGYPIEAIEDVIDTIDVPQSWVGDYIALRVSGDSMYPEYLDGDTIIIHIQPDCESGDDCACYIGDYETTFKRVYKNNGSITLQPLNPKYPPMTYTHPGEVNILGKVVELRRSK